MLRAIHGRLIIIYNITLYVLHTIYFGMKTMEFCAIFMQVNNSAKNLKKKQEKPPTRNIKVHAEQFALVFTHSVSRSGNIFSFD
jgi:hypothetical protein